MLPLRDDIPSSKRPIVTYLLVAMNVAVFIYQLSLGRGYQDFVISYGVIPQHILSGYDFYTLLTSMFMHGGFWHILGNMLYLWIFGDNVEDALGKFWFIVMYFLAGIGGSVAHILVAQNSTIPTIGASGAISGVLGAYLILYPKAKVLALVPIIFFIRFIMLPAYIFLGFWIFLQLILGVGGTAGGAGVAYFAHIGGFVIGVIFGLLFKKKQQRFSYEIY
jgi:membrane associated rhomboid family serine protease